jgi:hypothetical protein
MTNQQGQAPADSPLWHARPATEPPRPPGRLIQLEPYLRRRAETQQEAGLNALWDELLVAVGDAWCWRDPESVRAVEESLERVKTRVVEDWGYPVRKG